MEGVAVGYLVVCYSVRSRAHVSHQGGVRPNTSASGDWSGKMAAGGYCLLLPLMDCLPQAVFCLNGCGLSMDDPAGC